VAGRFFRLSFRDLAFSGLAGADNMTGDAHGGRNGGGRRDGDQSAEEAALSARLKRLDDRLSGLRSNGAGQTDETGGDRAARASAMARGLRLSSELVAGVVLGAAIGWVLDRFLSTSPWGLIVFLLLGFAAGVLNVMRVAGVVPPNRLDPPESRK
jgi:ATP synthase protein I